MRTSHTFRIDDFTRFEATADSPLPRLITLDVYDRNHGASTLSIVLDVGKAGELHDILGQVLREERGDASEA